MPCEPCGKKVIPPHDEHTFDGCGLWRIAQPFAELQRQGYGKVPGRQMSGADWDWKDSSTLEQNVDVIALWYDGVILPRLSWRDHRIGKRFIDALHRAGLACVAECDDDLVSPEVNKRIQQTHEPNLGIDELERRRIDRLAAMRLTDGITVSSRRLATVIRTVYDGPVCVAENAIDIRWWRRVMRHSRREVPGLTIGWAGGARPEDDLEPMAWAWGQIAQRYPDVTFVVAGHQPDVIGRYVPAHRVRRLQWLPVEAYPLNLRQIDVACCAVSDEPFNRCKTPIKVWEATLAGSVVAATPTLYGQAVDDGIDGLLAETADEWNVALRRLVEDAELRRELRKAQRRRVLSEHSLEKQVYKWPLAWGQIVSEFKQSRQRPRLIAV